MENGIKGCLAAVIAGIAGLAVAITLLVGMGQSQAGACGTGGTAATQPRPSSAAGAVPSNYLTLYQQAGQQYGIPWVVLAGIGEVETDHGQSNAAGVHSGANFAGAEGPMQFLPGTWAQYGDGGDVYNPADAIPAAARYLRASGAPGNLQAAIWAYNHSTAYYNEVIAWAGRYAAGGYTVTAANLTGTTCSLPPGTPLGQAIVAYAAQFKGLPYVWGGEDPRTGFDCSGLVQYVYEHFGIHLPRTADLQADVGTRFTNPARLQPGDLVFSAWDSDAGANGVGHVGIYAGGGRVFEASQTGVPLRYVALNSNYLAHVKWFTRVTQLAPGGTG